MIDDDIIPAFCRIPADLRAEAWRRNPPKTVQASSAPARASTVDEAALAEFEEQRKMKTSARIRRLLESKAPKPDLTGQRWCHRSNRWVADNKVACGINPTRLAQMREAEAGVEGPKAATRVTAVSKPRRAKLGKARRTGTSTVLAKAHLAARDGTKKPRKKTVRRSKR